MKKVLLLLIIFVAILGITACKKEHSHTVTSELIVVKEATCSTEGQGHMFCAECGEIVNSVAIPKTQHTDVVIPAVESTCTESGLTEGKKCSICGDTLVAQQKAPLKAHTEEIIPAVESTCTKKGLTEGKKCSVCGEFLKNQQEAPLKAHTEVIIPAVEPTCTETGLSEGKYCSACDTILVERMVVDPRHKPHNFVCTVCGENHISNGLRFESNGDGTCAVVGMGTCTDLEVSVPSVSPDGDTVTSVGSWAFSGRKSVIRIMLPESITSIGNSAFHGCRSLTSVIIGNSVISIGDNAFNTCHSLTSFVIPDSMAIIEPATFAFCISISNVRIPDSVTSIGMSSFYNCESLTSITIPDSVKSIGNYAFKYCSSLVSFCFEGTLEQWNAISKDPDWDLDTGSYIIYCTDGEIAKDGTVTIFSDFVIRVVDQDGNPVAGVKV